MELPGLSKPSQLSECLDWEVTHVNETIWKAFAGERRLEGMERARAFPQRRRHLDP